MTYIIQPSHLEIIKEYRVAYEIKKQMYQIEKDICKMFDESFKDWILRKELKQDDEPDLYNNDIIVYSNCITIPDSDDELQFPIIFGVSNINYDDKFDGETGWLDIVLGMESNCKTGISINLDSLISNMLGNKKDRKRSLLTSLEEKSILSELQKLGYNDAYPGKSTLLFSKDFHFVNYNNLFTSLRDDDDISLLWIPIETEFENLTSITERIKEIIPEVIK